MSHRAHAVFSALLLTLACSSSKPSESSTPEPPAEAPSEPAAELPSEPAASEPAAPGSPAADGPAAPEAPSSAPVIETLLVRDQRAPCEAEGQRECLQVKNSARDEWRNLFSPITGFEYEPGSAYELKVEVSRVINPPKDAAALKYRLVEVVSKRKTGQ
jgi:hypothetical protein